MSIHITNAEVERLLAEIAERWSKDRQVVLLELLRTEQQRLAAETDARLARVREATTVLQATIARAEVIDPRSPDEIVAHDDHGLPR